MSLRLHLIQSSHCPQLLPWLLKLTPTAVLDTFHACACASASASACHVAFQSDFGVLAWRFWGALDTASVSFLRHVWQLVLLGNGKGFARGSAILCIIVHSAFHTWDMRCLSLDSLLNEDIQVTNCSKMGITASSHRLNCCSFLLFRYPHMLCRHICIYTSGPCGIVVRARLNYSAKIALDSLYSRRQSPVSLSPSDPIGKESGWPEWGGVLVTSLVLCSPPFPVSTRSLPRNSC